MSDIDALRARGITYRCLVDAQGVAVDGTLTVAQLRSRGFSVVCQVDALGLADDASTLIQLRSRGIPAFCAVDETGVDPDTSATSITLRNRGITPLCAVDASGIALNGTATITQLRQRGIGHFCPLDETGTATTLVSLLPAPADPTLTLVSGAGDNTPELEASFDLALATSTPTRFKYATLSDFSNATDFVGTIAAPFPTFSPLADGPWYFRVDIEQVGHAVAHSNVESETIDATAPTLSSPTGVKTGETTATLTVSTNEANGTKYTVLSSSGTAPTKAQVKAGKDHTGGAAAYVPAPEAVGATGVQTQNVTGLTGGTTYHPHFMQEDSVGNQSDVATASGFTTDSAVAPATWSTTDKSGVTLSNSNRTMAFASGGWSGARSNIAITTNQLVYFEIKRDAGTNFIDCGIANASQSFALNIGAGTPTHGAGIFSAGTSYRNVDSIDNGSDILTGAVGLNDVVCIAYNSLTQKLWMRVNGGNWNNSGSADPATGIGGFEVAIDGGPYYAFGGVFDAGDQLTANFASTNWAFTCPSGFSQLAA